MLRRLLFAAIVFIALAPTVANACSCMDSSAPCSQSWKSGTVIFLGTVIAKSSYETPERDGVNSFDSRGLSFRFSVTESFRGTAIPGEKIFVRTGNDGGDCGYPFVVGQSYLVYASGSKDFLTTGICSSTRPEVLVAGVMRQLRILHNGKRVDDLFGTIGTAPVGNSYDDLIKAEPLANIRVRAIGNRTPDRSTTTDTDGAYSFQSLPPGAYRVEVDLPTGMSTWQRNRGETIAVKIGDEGFSGCRVDVFARPDGQISGRLVDEANRGVAGFVTYQPADPKEAEGSRLRGGGMGYTSEDGSFRLWLIPPGRYRLKFHPMINGTVSFRVPAVWSDIIEISFGQHIVNFRFNVSTIKRPPE